MSRRRKKKNKVRKRFRITNAKRQRRYSKILKLANLRRNRQGGGAQGWERTKAKETRANIVADAKKIPKRKRYIKAA